MDKGEDFDILKFFNGFRDNTRQLIQDYIDGKITKEEYLRRMELVQNSNN